MNDFYNQKTIVALDNFSPTFAEEIMNNWDEKVFAFKLNHVLYEKVNKTSRNIFCDYKLLDIPNTMCSVIEKLIDDGTDMVTIHMLNNQNSIEAISKYADKIKLLGVTYLTSWTLSDGLEITHKSVASMFDRSIKLMEDNGFWGAICSPKDLMYLQNSSLKKICPGIRTHSDAKDDQKRTMTPEKAIETGADYLVMGRSFFNNNTQEK